jgi:uncharacterized protein YbcI
MDKIPSTTAQQIAQAASEFELQRTGHLPASVTVVLGGDTVVITVHGCLSLIERALAMNPEGAAQIREYHRQLFLATCGALRQQIKTITGVDVREASAEIDAAMCAVAHVFTNGTMVQVFLLADSVAPDIWSSIGSEDLPQKAGAE